MWLLDVLALAVAGISLAISWRVGRDQVKLQERTVKLEEDRDQAEKAASQRAGVTCSAEWGLNHDKQMQNVLRVANRGPSEARNVKVMIDGRPLAAHPCTLDPFEVIPVIGPETHVDVGMAFTKTSPRPPFEIAITWEDDSGVKNPPFRTTVKW